jgi:hypothetical protein
MPGHFVAKKSVLPSTAGVDRYTSNSVGQGQMIIDA